MADSAPPGQRVPLVSVIIPCFNDGRFLAQSIESVLSQVGAPPAEVIVVDDCSTDADTQRVLSRYADHPAVRVMRTAHNAGPAAARSLGISLSQGEWVSFLDADDTWLPNALATLWGGVTAYAEAEFVGADHAMHYEDGTIEGQGVFQARSSYRAWAPAAYAEGRPVRFRRPAELFLDSVMASTCCVLVSRRAIERVGGFDPRLRQAEDVHLWLRLAASTDFVFCPTVITHRRIRRDSLSRQQATANPDWAVQCFRALLSDPRLARHRPGVRRRLRMSLLSSSSKHLREGDFRTALMRAANAVVVSPYHLSAWKQVAVCLLAGAGVKSPS